MKEVKPSKKPLAIYYAIVLAVLLLLNLVLLPWMSERQGGGKWTTVPL